MKTDKKLFIVDFSYMTRKGNPRSQKFCIEAKDHGEAMELGYQRVNIKGRSKFDGSCIEAPEGYLDDIQVEAFNEAAIEEGNRLISGFMGNEKPSAIYGNPIPYHSNWNCLMAVIEKIEYLSGSRIYDVRILGNDCEVITWEGEEIVPMGKYPQPCEKIQAVWSTVVEFVKWHNAEAERDPKKCPNCGYEMGEGYENCGASEDGKCPECGHTQKMYICPSCGEEIPWNDVGNYCSNCGDETQY